MPTRTLNLGTPPSPALIKKVIGPDTEVLDLRKTEVRGETRVTYRHRTIFDHLRVIPSVTRALDSLTELAANYELWEYQVVPMNYDAEGKGPCDVNKTAFTLYEVWDSSDEVVFASEFLGESIKTALTMSLAVNPRIPAEEAACQKSEH